jgi:hypothetical protein
MFLRRLNQVNPLLFRFGWIMWAGAFISLVLTGMDKTEVLGINAWIKPMKFFTSVAIMTWTMGYIFQWLDNQRAVSWALVAVMAIELFIISLQSARGERSHFNVTSQLNSIFFGIMGGAILLFTLWTAFMCFLFFRQKQFKIPPSLVWGIRLGLLLFVFFASEGGVMVQRLAHTVGGPDGGPGLPLVNWSTSYGDLRVAHFFGLHSLQILPLYGAYMARSKRDVIVFSVIYFLAAASLLIMSLKSIPLYRG